jgi:ankyrin repeat protein
MAMSTPFIRAFNNSKYEAVELLLQHGAKIKFRCIPWYLYRDARMMEILLRYGYDPNSMYGARTLLIHVIVQGTIEVVELLLDYGADPSKPDKNGRSPISIALQGDNINTITLLCKRGADLTVRENGMTLTEKCAQHIFHDNLLILLKYGAPCDIEKIHENFRSRFTDEILELIKYNNE